MSPLQRRFTPLLLSLALPAAADPPCIADSRAQFVACVQPAAAVQDRYQAKGASGPGRPRDCVAAATKGARVEPDRPSAHVRFDFDSAGLDADEQALLRDIAAALNSELAGVPFRLLGHTDRRGGDDYNQGLSQRRAQTVYEFLVAQGVSPTCLTTEGRGEREPIDPADNEAAFARNRRVQFVPR